MDELIHVSGGALELRSEPERILSYRVMRWGELAETAEGFESFERGAFAGTNPASVVLRMDHQDPAVARGLTLDEREDGAYMEFRVAKTARGDELLALVSDGIYRGASVGFVPLPNGTETRQHEGRRHNIRRKVSFQEVGATWRPAYASAELMSVRSADTMIESQPATNTPATGAEIVASAAIVPVPVTPAAAPDLLDRILTRLDAMELRSRQEATAPAPITRGETGPSFQDWVRYSLRTMAGERVPELETRALAEIITGTNLGVVPPAYANELIGVIDPSRPFMETTRQLTKPASGMKLIVPRLVTRPTVGIQAAEKDELASTNTAIDTVEFGIETVGGAGNLSLQLLVRSDPSFQELYVRLLGEAFAIKTDKRALVALLKAGIEDGGTFDVESPSFGSSFANGFSAMRQPPNRLWMSVAAYAAFIDAKEPAGGGGAPLYPGLGQIGTITVSGAAGPEPMTLRPVVVPGLDELKASPDADLGAVEVPDMIVGRESAFAWAEDGTYTLQADNPGQAGREVALVGMDWYAPLYPGAFTGFSLT